MTNKVNRKNYEPKEPQALMVNPKLQEIEGTEHLQVIKTDRELRLEGRKQHHCIGSRHYIEKALRGYNAVNYKGYTFFFSPTLTLLETSGKYNSRTPEVIKNELLTLIKAG